MRKSVLAGAFAAALAFFAQPFIASTAHAQFAQADNQPLIGSGAVGNASQGVGMSMSADGLWLAVAGNTDDTDTGNGTQKGAVWIYTRSGTSWSQHSKIVPVDAGADANISAVALSGDGNFLVIGAPGAAPGTTGQAWIFQHNGGTWNRLVTLPDTPPPASDRFGTSVAISADGSKILVGAPGSNSTIGGATLYTFDTDPINLAVTETKSLLPSPTTSDPMIGTSVAISGNGNVIMLGGPYDGNNGVGVNNSGAVWMSINGGNSFTKIKPNSPSDGANFGAAISLSHSGNVAVIGAPGEDASDGGVFVYSRALSALSSRIVASDSGSHGGGMGASVAMDADGTTMLVGGPAYLGGKGAAWVFSGRLLTWQQQGPRLLGTNGTIGANQGASVALGFHGDVAAIGGPANGSGAGAAWVYYQTPVVTAVTPDLGDVDGTTPVKVTGTGLGNVTVKFNNVVAPPQADAPASTTEAFVTAPVNGAGVVDVVATNGLNLSGTGTGIFTYGTPVPIVTSISPNAGAGTGSGSLSVSIEGSYFSNVDVNDLTSVKFGAANAQEIVVRSDGLISVTAPPHAAGEVTVTVRNANGTSVGDSNAKYTYGPVTVSSVSPASGPPGGGTTVTITGTKFQVGFTSDVLFGGVSAQSYTVDSDTQITAQTPAHAAGAVDVTVVNFIGNGVKAGGFSYADLPTITAINPNTGPASGGTLVSIVGTNLTGATAVKFGATAASSFSASSATTATATAPAHAVGAVNVTITTPGGTSTAAAGNKFTYTMTPRSSAIAKFKGGKKDGGQPVGWLIADKNGVLYGTTTVGGPDDKGTVFSLTPGATADAAWTKKILHSFTGNDGAAPYAGLAIDTDGNLYGTTTTGGANDKGVVFKLAKATFTYSVLYSFTGAKTDGGNPYAGVAWTKTGLIGATTTGGSKNKGTVFKLALTANAKPALIHSFTGGADGDTPYGTPIVDKDGNVYGTTVGGGAKFGIAYKLTPGGVETKLHVFAKTNDGHQPFGGLTPNNANTPTVLFGSTDSGGSQDKGAIFDLMPPATGDMLLFSFTGTTGANPHGALALDKAGALYGTAQSGGALNRGVVFVLRPPVNGQPDWRQSVLYSFDGGVNGAFPNAGVLLGKNKVLYGTTTSGGGGACDGGCGTVFKLEY